MFVFNLGIGLLTFGAQRRKKKEALIHLIKEAAVRKKKQT